VIYYIIVALGCFAIIVQRLLKLHSDKNATESETSGQQAFPYPTSSLPLQKA
jgi:hypothetical protein